MQSIEIIPSTRLFVKMYWISLMYQTVVKIQIIFTKRANIFQIYDTNLMKQNFVTWLCCVMVRMNEAIDWNCWSKCVSSKNVDQNMSDTKVGKTHKVMIENVEWSIRRIIGCTLDTKMISKCGMNDGWKC